ncbi:transcriptional regulator, LacI family [Succinivibrio dextrinosolvens]|uniref:LacI family DNA-binding transcriptional regulator n=1 Tax=Succinivibrio dextrinosolvens TaxID=83771 RepID=UPI0008EBFCB3|nr:LacI family DNA-binding transcriptional regulator [Succinivibrio dextrinosolvens]SFS35702.1 transcriptional regulator, LacI family [Succinivibrio dextrinosolvens]
MTVTVKTLAKAAGVSRGTVDRVLHNRGSVKKELALKIKTLAKELGYVPNRAGRALSGIRDRFKIGVLLPSIGNIFFEGVIEGIEKAISEYEELGVDVIYKKVQGYDEKTHLEAIDELKQMGCSALCLATIDTESVAQKINECELLGIKVILVNSDVKNCKRVCYVGSDYQKAGKTCAGLLSLISKFDKLNILVVTGSSLMHGHRKRIEGFVEELKNLNVDFEICGQIESNDSDIQAQIQTSKYLNEHNEVNCVYVTGAGVQGVGASIIATGRDDIIGIAFDDIYTTVEMVRAGIYKFVICQQPDRQGYHAIKRAYQVLSGTINETGFTDFYTDTIIKIASNIGK